MSVFGGVLGPWRRGIATDRTANRAHGRTDDGGATVDYVLLAESSVVAVPRNNLAAAKALFAVRRVADRRAAAGLSAESARGVSLAPALTPDELLARWSGEAAGR
jgi:hypothetical protein